MKRATSVLGGLVLLMAASVIPVAADTTGGGNQLESFAGACVGDVCTDTTVSAFLDPSGGTACLDILTYTDKTFISDEYGCAPAPSFTIRAPWPRRLVRPRSPSKSATRQVARIRTVTISASDTPTGPITTSSGRSTTKDGTCTSKIRFTDRSASVVGTFTIDDTTTPETGDVSTHTETSKTTCRS